METVTISKVKYQKLVKRAAENAKVDKVLVQKIKRAFEDIKHGRISEWKH